MIAQRHETRRTTVLQRLGKEALDRRRQAVLQPRCGRLQAHCARSHLPQYVSDAFEERQRELREQFTDPEYDYYIDPDEYGGACSGIVNLAI